MKKFILNFAEICSLFWFIIPSKIRRFIFTSLFILESRGMSKNNALKNLFLINDKLDWVINERAIAYGSGVHPKHRLTDYHKFFIKE